MNASTHAFYLFIGLKLPTLVFDEFEAQNYIHINPS